MNSKQKIFFNFMSVSSVRMANYLFPLITIPYVVRVIGPDNYGNINFASTLIGYFVIFINYSFLYSATRDIARIKGNKNEINKVFSSVITAKLSLFIISTIVFLVLFLFVDILIENQSLYIFTYAMVIGIILFPDWYFIGTGELWQLSMFNLIVKILFTGLIFIFIQNKEDYIMFPLSISIGQIAAGGLALWYVVKHDKIDFRLSTWKETKNILTKGLPIFLSLVFVSIYSLTNITLLGFMSTNSNVGYFSAATKVVSMVITIVVSSLGMAMYPVYATKFDGTELKERIKMIQKNIILVSILTIPISIIILLFADSIITIIFGSEFIAAVSPLKIIAILPIVFGLSNILVVQTMFVLKMEKEFMAISIIGVIVSIILNLFMIPIYSINGAAFTWLVVELLVTFISYIVLRRRGYDIIDRQFIDLLVNIVPLIKNTLKEVIIKDASR
jgi:PST family polysaccharide transporter